MYGDTTVLRRQAARLREQADDLRGIADRLVSEADDVTWSGRAAEAMRERVRERAATLRRLADSHDTAADSLGVHLAEVDRLNDAIAEVQRRVRARTAEAAARVAEDRAEPGDATWRGFVGPPTGHRDWLSVSLPGL